MNQSNHTSRFQGKGVFTALIMFVITFFAMLLTPDISEGAYSDITLVPYATAVDSGTIENRTNIDYKEAIHKDRKGVTFFTYVIRKFNSRPAKTSIVRGFEQRSVPFILQTNSNISSPASAADDPMNIVLKAGQVDFVVKENLLAFDFDADEANGYTAHVRVTAKVNSTTITVKPQDPTMKIGKSASVGVPADTIINVTGSAFKQNSDAEAPLTVMPTVVENVTQIQRDFIALSETAMTERLYGETERSRQRQVMEQIHAYKRENTMLFNGRKVLIKSSTSSDKIQKGIMQGFEYTILKNSPKNDQYDVHSYSRFLDFLAGVFDPLVLDGAQTKRMAFTNQAGRRMLTDLKMSQYGGVREIEPNKGFGVSGVDTVYADSGTLDLFLHPIVNAKYKALNEPYFMVFHPAYVEYSSLRSTRLQAGIQNPQTDGVMDAMLTEETHQVYLPELHGIYRKVRA